MQLLAFDLDWEALAPIIFFVLYGIGQLFSKKNKGEDEAESEDTETSKRRAPTAQQQEASERARRVQEEIRRKIAERRAGGEAPTQPASRPASAPAGYDPTLPESMQRRERVPETPVAPARPAPIPMPTRTQPAQTLSREQGRSNTPAVNPAEAIQKRIAEQRARAAQAAKEREAAERKSAAALKKAGKAQEAAIAAAEIREGTTAAQVRQDLRDPHALRRAIVLNEVLGQPTALRKGVGHEAA